MKSLRRESYAAFIEHKIGFALIPNAARDCSTSPPKTRSPPPLSQDISDHLAVNVGQAEVTTLATEREALVINTQ